jgi:hypothetical protein
MADNEQRQPDNGNRMDRFERGLEQLLAAQAKHEASAETQHAYGEESDERLNAHIKTVDEMIRRRPPEARST